MEVSTEILDFLTGVYGDRADPENRKEPIFDRAFELAYKDMATHTVAYTDDAKEKYVGDDSKRCNGNKIEIRNTIKEYVMKNIFLDVSLSKSLAQINSQAAFNKWHEKACESITNAGCGYNNFKVKLTNKDKSSDTVEIYKLLCHIDREIKGVFSYGQAQKLINMMVKYLYIFYQCEGWSYLKNIEKYAHVPIDSYVLRAVFKNETYKGVPWSKIASYPEYMECKKRIDEKAEEDMPHVSSFMWELANWPFNN